MGKLFNNKSIPHTGLLTVDDLNYFWTTFKTLGGTITDGGNWYGISEYTGDIGISWILNGEEYKIASSQQYCFDSDKGSRLIRFKRQRDGKIMHMCGFKSAWGNNVFPGIPTENEVYLIENPNVTGTETVKLTSNENWSYIEFDKTITKPFTYNGKKIIKMSNTFQNGIDWHSYDAAILNDVANRPYIKLGYQPVSGGEWLRTSYVPRMGGTTNIQWDILGESFHLFDGILNGINDVNMLGFHRISDGKEFWLIGQKSTGDRKVPNDGELYLKEGSYAGDGAYRKLKDLTPNVGTFAEKNVLTLTPPIKITSATTILSPAFNRMYFQLKFTDDSIKPVGVTSTQGKFISDQDGTGIYWDNINISDGVRRSAQGWLVFSDGQKIHLELEWQAYGADNYFIFNISIIYNGVDLITNDQANGWPGQRKTWEISH